MGSDDKIIGAGVTAGAPAARGQDSLESYMDQGSGIEAGRLARGEESRWGKKEKRRQRILESLQAQREQIEQAKSRRTLLDTVQQEMRGRNDGDR